MAMAWVGLQGQSPDQLVDQLGFLPGFFDANDPRSAKEQIDTNYAHGGGWRRFDGFMFDKEGMTLIYPGDPPFKLLAASALRDEALLFFEHEWLVIVQPDGSWEAARVE